MSESEEWSESERARLAALEPIETPSPELEARVVEALRARHLIRPPQRRIHAVAIAAALGAFVCGVGLGRATGPARPRSPAAPDTRLFALLLYPGEAIDPTPDAARGRVEEYRRWARALAAQGRLLSGEKLGPSGRVVRSAAGPVPEATADLDGGMQGFFLVRARTLEEAAALARTCPHVRHGGTIALREVDPT